MSTAHVAKQKIIKLYNETKSLLLFDIIERDGKRGKLEKRVTFVENTIGFPIGRLTRNNIREYCDICCRSTTKQYSKNLNEQMLCA